jgi:ATP-binding cassette, subfamily B, bacterial PglK
MSDFISKTRKKEINLVLLLSIVCSLTESFSIAMLVPFISFFVNPDNYIFNTYFRDFFEYFNITDNKDILSAIVFGFILMVLLSLLLKLKFIKSSNNLTDNIISDFRIRMFEFLINQDYSYHLKHGTNKILSNFALKTGPFNQIIFSAINIINSTLICVAVISILIFNEPFYTPIAIVTIIVFFLIIYRIKSSSVLKKGQIQSKNQDFMIDIFQNSVGYLPEIIIYNLKNFFLKTLSRLSKELSKNTSEVRTIGMTPKIYLETFIIISVISIVYIASFSDRSLETNLSYIAILIFGAQKCLPQINNIYSLSINFRVATPSVNNFLKVLDGGQIHSIIDHKYNDLKFEKSIKIENISFQYNKHTPNIINKFNFEILKGQKIAIKGQTGSGKSTLANIISGLILPTLGNILVDDVLIDSQNLKNWQQNIAIVPQTIFLNDATVLENIAIGVDIDVINYEKVIKVAKLAQIDSFIESLPNKYKEKVGERGVRLSGGQRQRLGVARALYRDPKVIILDEPTNALDAKTEKLLMDSIILRENSLTLIMISHSVTSLEYFDKVIDLNKVK